VLGTQDLLGKLELNKIITIFITMEYQRPIYDISIDEAMHLGVDQIAFVEDPAIQELWVAMANEITKLLLSEDDKMIVTGPALVPDKLIYRVHPKTGQEYYIRFSEETIQAIVKRYFTQNRQIHFNLEHNKENDVQGVILESWIVKDPNMDQSVSMGFKDLKKGTWMISVQVEDQQFWNEYVKTGQVRGFSIEGSFAQSLAEAMANQELVVEPRSGESKDEFVSRCIGVEIDGGMDPDQATAVCYSKWDEGVKLDLKEFELTPEEAELLIKEVLMAQNVWRTYPKVIKENAQRALDYAEKNGWGSCGTPVGKKRANDLASGRPLSEETLARMASFARHLQYDNKELGDGCGKLMILAWGGREGIQWAQRELNRIRRQGTN
jgi:hypothetical protein